jgi:integration host factor subunit alpha
MSLTKADIITAIQKEIGFTKNQSTELVESLLEIIKSKLETGEDVLVSVKEKSERRGRNPATGDDLILRPRRVVTFKVSGKLKEKVNG